MRKASRVQAIPLGTNRTQKANQKGTTMSMGKSRSASKHTPTGKAVKSGGGYSSLKVREKREATRERPRVKAANPSMVSDWGAHRGAHVTSDGGRDVRFKNEPLYQGNSFQACEFGNTKALEGSGKGARPGGGNRTLYGKSGTQQQYGPSAPAAKDYSVDVPATARSQRSLSEKGRVG